LGIDTSRYAMHGVTQCRVIAARFEYFAAGSGRMKMKGGKMKRTIISLACALVAPLAFGQTSTTTTEQTATSQPTTTTETTRTSTTSGTVTTYKPGKTIVVRERDNPISFVLGKTVHYVNKAGREIDRHIIRPGTRVIVHYTGVGEHRRVERVEVQD
jgi:ribosomal protein S17